MLTSKSVLRCARYVTLRLSKKKGTSLCCPRFSEATLTYPVKLRYILQLEKYTSGDFGYCSRVYCENQPMMPIGKCIYLSLPYNCIHILCFVHHHMFPAKNREKIIFKVSLNTQQRGVLGGQSCNIIHVCLVSGFFINFDPPTQKLIKLL